LDHGHKNIALKLFTNFFTITLDNLCFQNIHKATILTFPI